MNEIFHYSSLRIYQRIGKNMFSIGENGILEPIGNSAHTTECLALRKALNIHIDYLMFYPSRQHVK